MQSIGEHFTKMEESMVKTFHERIEMDICTRLDRLESAVNTLVAKHGAQQSLGLHAQMVEHPQPKSIQIDGSVSTSSNGQLSFFLSSQMPQGLTYYTAPNLPVAEEGNRTQVINMEDIDVNN